jgi:hypothetical protein
MACRPSKTGPCKPNLALALGVRLKLEDERERDDRLEGSGGWMAMRPKIKVRPSGPAS